MTALQTQNTALKQVNLSLDLLKAISVYVLVDVFQTSFYKKQVWSVAAGVDAASIFVSCSPVYFIKVLLAL